MYWEQICRSDGKTCNKQHLGKDGNCEKVVISQPCKDMRLFKKTGGV